MRVLYIASQWDYGHRERGPSFEEQSFSPAWEAKACEMKKLDVYQVAKDCGVANASQVFRRTVSEWKPDIIFMVLINSELSVADVKWAGMRSVTVNWFCDDHWRFEKFSKVYAPHLHLSVTTDKESVAKYRRVKARVLLSQWASPFRKPVDAARCVTGRLVFVGQRYGRRSTVMNALAKTGVDACAYGTGWADGRLPFGQLGVTFREAGANLNFSDSWARPWSLRRKRKQLKARVFEVVGAGGLLLTEHTDGLGEYLEPGVACLSWRTIPECIEMARFALDNPAVCGAIAERGEAEVRRRHLYCHRVADILQCVERGGAFA